jgi:uncharacterized protein YdeI (BOF family)
MNKSLPLCLTLLALSGISFVRANDDPDTNREHISTVAWIQEQDRADNLDADDRYVVLIGKITEKYKDETYFFNDGTGTIQLDSEARLPVGANIVVRGKIDQAFLGIGKLEVDVTSWRHVK